MNECLKVLTTRRSVKNFKSDPVPETLLEEVLKAGINAPTGKNRQAPVMVAVTDYDTVRDLAQLNAKVLGTEADTFYGAPVVVIVFTDSTINTHLEDGSLVLGNMLNAAHSLGLGACWVHRAKEVFQTEEGKAYMKKWGLDDKYIGVGNCILGYAAQEPAPKEHKENYVIYDK